MVAKFCVFWGKLVTWDDRQPRRRWDLFLYWREPKRTNDKKDSPQCIKTMMQVRKRNKGHRKKSSRGIFLLISDLSLRFFSTGSLLGDQDHCFLCKPYNTVFSHYSIFVCKCEIKLHDALLDSIDRFEILSFALLREQAIFFSQWNFVVRVTDWLHEESVEIIFTKISGHKSQ